MSFLIKTVNHPLFMKTPLSESQLHKSSIKTNQIDLTSVNKFCTLHKGCESRGRGGTASAVITMGTKPGGSSSHSSE